MDRGCDDLESFKRAIFEFPASVYCGKGHITADESEIDASLFEGADIPGGAVEALTFSLRVESASSTTPEIAFPTVHGPAAVGSSDRQDF